MLHLILHVFLWIHNYEIQCSISAKKNRLKSNEVHVGIKTTTSKWKIQFNFVDLCRLITDNSDELLSNDYCGLTELITM